MIYNNYHLGEKHGNGCIFGENYMVLGCKYPVYDRKRAWTMNFGMIKDRILSAEEFENFILALEDSRTGG